MHRLTARLIAATALSVLAIAPSASTSSVEADRGTPPLPCVACWSDNL